MIGGALGILELAAGAFAGAYAAAAMTGAEIFGGWPFGGACLGGGRPYGALIVGARPGGAPILAPNVYCDWSLSPFSISLVMLAAKTVPNAIAGLEKSFISRV